MDGYLLGLMFAASAVIACGVAGGCDEAHEICVIPRPAVLQRTQGQFVINKSTRILVEGSSREAAQVGKYLSSVLRLPTGYTLPVKPLKRAAEVSDVVLLTMSKEDQGLGSEGYELTVEPHKMVLRAAKPAGLFHGVQTLRQLLPVEIFNSNKADGVVWSLPCVSIKDCPRYAWRGMHIDVCRHFQSLETLKRYIDLLAMHKMNVLHLHLTDDQGWRIEIKKYPKLTDIGAWRVEADGTKYGGYYTQAQLKDLVWYAREQFVEIVPEIEMPGHSTAALAALPQISCSGGPFTVPNGWGVFKDVYCAGNEETFSFMADVIEEVAKVFPGKYIHIGGDECPKDRWSTCTKCTDRIRTEKLKDTFELQSYFIKRAEKIVNSKGRSIIGWDEILEGGLAPNATVMSWRGTSGGTKAAQEGHDVVMCPTSHCYFDYDQSSTTPLQKVYSYEPTPKELTPEQAKHILGAQGNLWSEWIKDQDRLDFMAFPRACALAEVVWSPRESRDWDSFRGRLQVHYSRLKNKGVKYCQTPD